MQESQNSMEERILELQMLLTNSSFGHEYARMEMEKTRSNFKRSMLVEKLENFRRIYFEARHELAAFSPDIVESIEKDLATQKTIFFTPVATASLH